MKEVTLKIPEDRYDFIMELIANLGLEVEQEIEIPEWQKQVLNERLEKYRANPSTGTDADEVLNRIEKNL